MAKLKCLDLSLRLHHTMVWLYGVMTSTLSFIVIFYVNKCRNLFWTRTDSWLVIFIARWTSVRFPYVWFCCTTARVVQKNESTNLLHGSSVPGLLHRTKRRLFVCVRVWTQQVMSVPVACVDCIFDVYTMIILLRLAWCSRVSTFSNVREFFRVCTLMVTRSHRCTHGPSKPLQNPCEWLY